MQALNVVEMGLMVGFVDAPDPGVGYDAPDPGVGYDAPDPGVGY